MSSVVCQSKACSLYITSPKFEECLSKQVCHYERAFSVSRRACGVRYGPNIILIKANISDQKYFLSESDASQDRYTNGMCAVSNGTRSNPLSVKSETPCHLTDEMDCYPKVMIKHN